MVFILAPQIAGLFGASNITDLTALALRCYIVGLPIIGIKMFFIYYFQSAEKKKLSIYSSVTGEFVFMVASLYVCGKLFGEIGLFVSYPIAEFVYILSLLIIAYVRYQHFPRTVSEMLFLKEDFDVDKEKVLDVSIHSLEEVSALSENAMAFCQKNGVDPRRSMLLSLIVEEMTGNIFEHGISDGKPHFVDMKIIILPDTVKLRLRDNCRQFNPKERAEMLIDDEPERNIGIRIVSRIAKSMNYANLFKLNQLTIEI